MKQLPADTPGDYVLRIGEEAERTGLALCDLLGVENAAQLAEVLAEVMARTRFGDVHLVIAEGRVTYIKATVSVKL